MERCITIDSEHVLWIWKSSRLEGEVELHLSVLMVTSDQNHLMRTENLLSKQVGYHLKQESRYMT